MNVDANGMTPLGLALLTVLACALVAVAALVVIATVLIIRRPERP